MLHHLARFSLLTLLLACSGMASAADPASVAGRWKTIDDETGTERSIVAITEVNGELQGRIEKIFLRADEKPGAVCEACDGVHKNQPIVGLTFLWGLRRDGEEWNSGAILDPKNGKVYNAKLSLADGGQKLRVRGYIGMPMLGRTQVWLREAD